tara:strand:- start:1026 stop:1322 length:297 start_codon:yes stop_codon:yes gene_type:complete
MNPIKVKTPQGELLLSHIKRTVKATGPETAVSWWKMEVKEGLYGVHGHLLDPNNCDIADVISAAGQFIGFGNIEIPEDAKKQSIKEIESYSTTTDHLP